MKRYHSFFLVVILTLGACAQIDKAYLRGTPWQQNGRLDSATMILGLRQALEQGTTRAVSALGRADGYFGNPQVKIAMPENLRRIEQTLRRLGQGQYADEFVLSMNRAAERAAPEAKAVFLNVIQKMSVPDAAGIIHGPDDAATAYFRRNSETDLAQRFHPIVAQATVRVGVTRQYKKMVQKLRAGSLLDTRSFDLDSYITQQALDGLFLLIAQEEKQIRTDPVARTTEVLRKVFGR